MSSQKKYEFTGEEKQWMGQTLKRIRALVDIPVIGVAAGDLGGWIVSEGSLSHNGNAWVFGNAWVSNNALVSDNARVSGNAWVSGRAKVSGRARVSPMCISGLPHHVTVTDTQIKVGRELHDKEIWAKRGAAIIKSDGYSTEQARAWASIINALAVEHTKMLEAYIAEIGEPEADEAEVIYDPRP